ncbi:antitoxin [Skermania sp. ID1734]|uniref:antitoxin n=1 Tax=Skermania sp. ID1734 TaxID=2597516 RepID=UPI0011817052|nr:antitoxin [Skermania sp. ID1734]TSE01398.1 antitoxin [Skermania sp. ID1734]
MNFDSIKKKLGEHKDQVDQGLDKAADAAKQRFEGHDDQIDQAVEKAKGFTQE